MNRALFASLVLGMASFALADEKRIDRESKLLEIIEKQEKLIQELERRHGIQPKPQRLKFHETDPYPSTGQPVFAKSEIIRRVLPSGSVVYDTNQWRDLLHSGLNLRMTVPHTLGS